MGENAGLYEPGVMYEFMATLTINVGESTSTAIHKLSSPPIFTLPAIVPLMLLISHSLKGAGAGADEEDEA